MLFLSLSALYTLYERKVQFSITSTRAFYPYVMLLYLRPVLFNQSIPLFKCQPKKAVYKEWGHYSTIIK